MASLADAKPRTIAGVSSVKLLVVCTTLGLAACAGRAPEPRHARGTYPGRCDLVAVEYADATPTETAPRPDVAERDSLLLVARYRDQGGSASPLQLGIFVRRADAEALRATLAGKPTVACRPDTGEIEPPPLPEDAHTVPTDEAPAPAAAQTAPPDRPPEAASEPPAEAGAGPAVPASTP